MEETKQHLLPVARVRRYRIRYKTLIIAKNINRSQKIPTPKLASLFSITIAFIIGTIKHHSYNTFYLLKLIYISY